MSTCTGVSSACTTLCPSTTSRRASTSGCSCTPLVPTHCAKVERGMVIWSIAARPSSYKKHAKKSLIGRMRRKIEYAKAQVRAKIEHPFRVIKRQFGYTKVRFRGLVKNTAQQTTLFALSNLWMMRKQLLNAGEMRL